MARSHWMNAVWLLATVVVGGCYPYRAYAPYGYPGVPVQPPGTLGPGTPLPQGQGSYVAPPGTSYGGAMPTSPRPADDWQRTQPIAPNPSGGGDAPPFNPDNGGSSAGQPVPNYSDPTTGSAGNSGSGTSSAGDSPFGFEEGAGVQLDGIEDQTADVGGPAARAEGGEVAFMEPIPLRSVSESRTASSHPETMDTPRPNPFAWDRSSYRWLRGIVDYDANEGTWHIIYADNPAPDDEYGGSFLLVDDPRLDDLQDGDVVLLEGRVDQAARDRLGKPMYRVENVARLKPKTTLAELR